jgi:hypothetical protein
MFVSVLSKNWVWHHDSVDNTILFFFLCFGVEPVLLGADVCIVLSLFLVARHGFVLSVAGC